MVANDNIVGIYDMLPFTCGLYGKLVASGVEVVSDMKIVILAIEGLFDTGLFVTLDTFALANNFSASQMGGTPRPGTRSLR
jgi:hypothetical protein